MAFYMRLKMKYRIEARINKTQLLSHQLVTSGTGGGKSQLIFNQILSLVRSSRKKRNCCIILQEPHADISKKLVAYRELDDDRIVYISTTLQRDSNYPHKISAGFNPMYVPADADDEYRNCLATQLASTIAELIENSQYGLSLNMEMLLRPSLLVLLYAAPEYRNMATLLRFFDDKNNADLLRMAAMHRHPNIRDFYSKQWGAKEYDISKRSIISKLSFFMNDVTLFDILQHDGVSIEECMNTGKVIIINAPRSNPFVASVIGRLMQAVVTSIAMRREAIPEKRRVPVYYYIDEASTYLSSSTATMLLELRKFKVGLTLCLQSTKPLDVKMKSAIITNTFTKCIGVCDAESRRVYAAETSLTTEQLAALEPLSFYVKRSDNSPAFRVKVPIVHSSLFLTGESLQKRYRFIIENSGVYRVLTPSPAPHPSEIDIEVKKENTATKKQEKKAKKDDNPFTAEPPAFN